MERELVVLLTLMLVLMAMLGVMVHMLLSVVRSQGERIERLELEVWTMKNQR